ncbi:Epimerase domain-containing protein [Fusarium falciforme]|uniref:Epimerase domain-containing protein n=1 Tax=Fusarium falciforme TaxID=195108 RepID=UPI00230053D9|nr:Epimerase domain-containing protein [Fusarium falciforme]WAO95668.1 Epimerase domain-containing protein [Fusarium falciforme]
MSELIDRAVPRDSIVLVTGANGFLGSHISDQFLHHGYRVRGTVRNLEKNAWLEKHFEGKYGAGRFDLVQVADMAAERAFHAVIKGVSIVAHTASVVSLDPDPNNTIPLVISGSLNALKAAYDEPSVKRFICTSSSASVYNPLDEPGNIVTQDTWNEEAIREAWKEPPYQPERGMMVYAAGKTQAEKEIWRFHKEHRHERADLVVNTILPSTNLGRPLDPVNQGYLSTSGFIPLLCKGETSPMHPFFPRQYYVHVQDTARLHVAAAILSTVKDERIFAFAGRFSWDRVLSLLREAQPTKTFPDDFSGGDDPHEVQDRDKAEDLLRVLGRPGWTSLEESVTDNIRHL